MDRNILRELWGGFIWGDCIGRIHRGWSPDAMDDALGSDFFDSLTQVADEPLDWQPEFRAVEPVQRRAFVELGLYGHSTQLALVAGALLASPNSIGFWKGFERAMDLDMFRLPNLELVPVMYQVCRRKENIGLDATHLFFPMLLVMAQHPNAKIEPALLTQLSSAYASFRTVLMHVESYEPMGSTARTIRDALDHRFGPLEGVACLDMEPLINMVEQADSPQSAWRAVRREFNVTRYVGSTLGFLMSARFGADAIVPWKRLKEHDRLEDMISGEFLLLDDCAAIETKLSNDESFRRDAYLAERRAG